MYFNLALKIVKSNFYKVKTDQNLNFVIDARNLAFMTATRLEQLIRFYEEDPADPFTLYGLALEYLKIDASKAEEYFDKLLADFSDYLPTYYHAGKLKATIGKRQTAIDIYEKGIQLAIAQQDKATQRELKSAYDELMFE